MNTKKSLGHFPFGSDALGKSDLSFIPNINGVADSEADEEVDSLFEVNAMDIENRKGSASDDLISSQLVERDVPVHEEPTPSKKKVASYYLEESLINRLKSYSDYNKIPYSATVTQAIEEFITGREF
ncbi:MAG: hypothetical protein EA390_07170 [Balneolaceae bacterium]|nr:MAG: hypothetical protein EA390_07170 [Balneolaceae bacterium]